MKRGVRAMLAVFFAAMLAFSVWKLCGLTRTYRAAQENYRLLEKYVSAAEPSKTPAAVQMSQSTAEAAVLEPRTSMQVDFEQLARINPDVVGWVTIEGTQVNYPVVQGEDNDEYLDRLFDGTQHRAGSIFMDSRCAADFSDRHSILYGHNMKDGSMFAALMGYKKQAFYDEHPTALLITLEGSCTVRFFAGYVADAWENAWQLEFSEEEYAQWLREIQQRSCFAAERSPDENDRILTLSTCSYEHDEARFVLHGIVEKYE